MKYDVVIGNPPYQNGQHKNFYISFIKWAYENLKPQGHVCMVNPHSWIANRNGDSKKQYKVMLANGFFNKVKEVDDVIFDIKFGGHLSYFLYQKDVEPGTAEVEWLNPIPEDIKEWLDSLNLKEAQRGLDYGDTSEYSEETPYELYLSSRSDRRSVWSAKPRPGYGQLKLIVSHILYPGKADHFTEIGTKGVGRYGKYFVFDTEEECKNAQAFFNSETYKKIDEYTRMGRYAYVVLPEHNWKEPWIE